MSDTIRPGNAPHEGAPLTHEQAIDGRMADAYVDGRLPEADAAAFEEHYFGCAECWAEVRALERLRAGVRDAAASGRMEPHGAPAVWTWGFAAAAVVLAGFASWTVLVQVPRLERELLAALNAAAAAPKQVEVPVVVAQANLPVLMLEASRAGEPAGLKLPEEAKQVALWMDGAAGAGPFRLLIADARGGEVLTLEGLRPNRLGSLTAAVPAGKLPPGKYTARLIGTAGALAAEYRFEVRR